MKILVVVPTYNESQNIEKLIKTVFDLDSKFSAGHSVNILVVDDNSPDNTAGIVQDMINGKDDDKYIDRLHILNREGKLGLGSAYVAGFKWGLKKGYDVIVEMDADFSHSPDYLPTMIDRLKEYDFIIGSRYVSGGGVKGWSFLRKFISIGGSYYARLILGIPLHDLTGGYNVWKKEVLESISPDNIKSDGYSFQIELKYKAFCKGFKFSEVPIIFENRFRGKSKMSKRIVFEAMYRVWQFRFALDKGNTGF